MGEENGGKDVKRSKFEHEGKNVRGNGIRKWHSMSAGEGRTAKRK